ncbi:hypothetical protein CRUP_002087 [Coryphaenoides rupestris]|nr:hypothetical protein CRUP_002087 [Coryphaenoides rupestris]
MRTAGKVVGTCKTGFFPSDRVRPFPCVPKPVDYSAQPWFNDEVKHIKILTKEACFYIAESRLFKSLQGFRSLDTTLQVPYRGLVYGNVPWHLPQASTVFSPRVVGTAVARYNFSSRDPRELSLAEGDVVKVYSKTPNGWHADLTTANHSPVTDHSDCKTDRATQRWLPYLCLDTISFQFLELTF